MTKVKKFKPSKCHPERPHFGLGMCYECYNAHVAKRKRDARLEFRLNNPLPPRPPRKTPWYHRNKDKALEKARIRNLAYYGLTPQDFDRMMDEQGGVCAICERPPKKMSLNIDHEHQKQEKKRSPESRKNRVRGLLCHRCNRALGLFGNDINMLMLTSKNF